MDEEECLIVSVPSLLPPAVCLESTPNDLEAVGNCSAVVVGSPVGEVRVLLERPAELTIQDREICRQEQGRTG